MVTLGLWLGPTLAVIIAAVGNRWLGWFRPKLKRRVALQRIAERLAHDDSQGYPWLLERYLEHYLGGRTWNEEWEKASTRTSPDNDCDYYDSRGAARKWWQRGRTGP